MFFFLTTSLLFLSFQALTIIAFNDDNIDKETMKEVLSIGPTYVLMKFIESKY
jgi:callose synthase